MIYTTFAQLYDQLMEPAFYTQWMVYARKRLIPRAPTLDLACGSGRLSVALAQAGYPVIGLDQAEDMLTLAGEHAATAGVTVTLVQGDMADLMGLPLVENVVCAADSLCYLPDHATLVRTFKAVYQRLKPGGVFLFDVLTPYQVDHVFPGYMYNYEDDEQAFMWTSYSGSEPHTVEHDLRFFVWNEALQGYRRYSELHRERTESLVAYRQLLQVIGFTAIAVTDVMGNPASSQADRWYFACHKPETAGE
ncbi:class I SAM-dependent DNA methyltransferase [Ligilactobacillus sp. LYQ60]|uniref:class I SAM-dependent DNA methyltransferase n=1 Tax=unclassified Ligilactobacillus TaxID=2767920 RepID=UPI00385383D8